MKEMLMTCSSEHEQQASPKVTIGLPTYNRSHLVRRAIESVLNQTYKNIELVISDNASTDDTQRVCEEYARTDTRVKYHRQASNIGPSKNFNAVLQLATSDYFMWLADDDWLEETYVSVCLTELIKNPDYSSVCAKTRYYHGNQFQSEGERYDFLATEPWRRVLDYYSIVLTNGVFYGIMRRIDLGDGFVPVQRFGEDWYLIASIAFLGKIKMVDTTSICRSLDGASSNFDQLFEFAGYSKAGRALPLNTIAYSAARDVLVHNKVYKTLPAWKRYSFAICIFFKLFTRLGIKELWQKSVGNTVIVPLKRSTFGKAIKSFVRR